MPDEISLTVTVSNCQYRCSGCHSSYLQRDVGEPLLPALESLIAPYEGLISCLCLMGEGQNTGELKSCLRTAKAHGLKTCLYSGCESVKPFEELLPFLNYLKVGGYDAEAGGLDSPATNQRFYHIAGETLADMTAKFYRRKEL